MKHYTPAPERILYHTKLLALLVALISLGLNILDGQLTQHLIDEERAVEANPLLAYLMYDWGYALSSIKETSGLIFHTMLAFSITYCESQKVINRVVEVLMIVTSIQFGVCVYQALLILLGT